MYKLLYLFIFLGTAIFDPVITFSQYILNGNAKQESCNCYLLTNAQQWQGGSVWQSTKIDLNNPFDFKFNVYLGDDDVNGADGIVFILQQQSYNLGAQGGGMGFDGLSPSIGIALDTWQNISPDNDPAYDHISIQKNGIVSHGNDLKGPIPASATSDNIEDGKWHVLQIKWEPSTKTLSTYFDGVFRLSTQTDLIVDIFKNDPMVYWGFSAGTGGKFNVQKFCTALNPVYNSDLVNDQHCNETSVTFKDSSTSFTTIKSYNWDFGDGTTSTEMNPPPHQYPIGIYQVKHSITAMDGCQSDPFIRTIRIGDNPEISFKIFDTCEKLIPRIDVHSTLKVGNINQWDWQVNGADFSKLPSPDFTSLLAGNYVIKLTAKSDIGCESNSYESNLIIKPNPVISIEANDGCVNIPVKFNGAQSDGYTSVLNWHWDFGDNQFSDNKEAQNLYSAKGNYNVLLKAKGANGCTSSVAKNIFINSAIANAGKDTLVASNTNFQLNGSGGTSYSWSPSIGLNNPEIPNPTGKISDNQRYLLTVKTAEGCLDTASVKVTVFKGSAIYVPTAFTPNNDGLNDYLKPHYLSIKTLYYFTIYNRWGQKVFSTRDLNAGWNGISENKQKIDGGYVWMLKAVDVVGKIYNLKGSFVLLK